MKGDHSLSSTPSHHRRSLKHREPSVHSISSSEISSEGSSIIHQRSTPKIAAVIIAAIIVIALLIGVTVYLVNTDKFVTKQHDAVSVLDKKIGILEQQADSERLNPDQYGPGMDRFRSPNQQLVVTNNYKAGKDPEGPPMYGSDDQEEYIEYYDEVANDQHHQLVVGGQGAQLGIKYYDTENMLEKTNEKQVNGLFGNVDFNEEAIEEEYVDEEPEEILMDDVKAPNIPYQAERPFGAKLNVPINHKFDLYNMEPYREESLSGSKYQPPLRTSIRQRQRFYRPHHLLSDKQKVSRILANRPLGYNLLQRNQNSDIEAGPGEINNEPPVPPNGSRGGIHVPVEEVPRPPFSESKEAGSSGLQTLDRRPGRPIFHHMGPPRHNMRPSVKRRYMMRPNFRPNQFFFNRRMGLASSTEDAPVLRNPLDEAKEMLAKIDDFMSLAEGEVQVLKEITRNITESGKEVNLYEMLAAVNQTVKENPNSTLAKLMDRFYNEYLMEEELNTNETFAVNGIYDKSLSSLLFLSFGIYLLNSVNDVISKSSLEEGRKFEDAVNIDTLLKRHDELQEIFEKTADFKEDSVAGKTKDVNSFLKLLMNLMNAYNSGDEEEIECIWSLYCQQLNRQAGMGGMVSSVARINSVGMKVVLSQIPSDSALKHIFRAMMSWENLKCHEMFPKCDIQVENSTEQISEQEIKNDKTEPKQK